MGVTFPSFHFVGYLSRRLMFLKILCKEEAIASAVSLKTNRGTLSGPRLFLVLISLQILAIVLFSMQYSLIVHVCEGIVFVWFESAPFGFTKTDTKYSLRRSAFSLSVTALLPLFKSVGSADLSYFTKLMYLNTLSRFRLSESDISYYLLSLVTASSNSCESFCTLSIKSDEGRTPRFSFFIAFSFLFIRLDVEGLIRGGKDCQCFVLIGTLFWSRSSNQEYHSSTIKSVTITVRGEGGFSHEVS